MNLLHDLVDGMVKMALTSADRLLAPAVTSTLAAIDLEVVDGTAAKLAERYASMIDEAKQAESWADSVLAKVDDDSDLYEEVRALKAKLGARVALSDLGPKLAAVLGELGATPMARARLAKLTPAAPKPAPSMGWLDEMRGGRVG